MDVHLISGYIIGVITPLGFFVIGKYSNLKL